MNNNSLLKIWGAVAAIAIVWLILDNRRQNAELQELLRKNEEKDDINEKLKEKIEESKDIPDSVKKELEELIQQYKDIDADVSRELMAASSLIEIKEYPKAIFTLTKVIENLLKEKYSKSQAFSDWKKSKGKGNPTFADFIEFAKEENFISKDEYHFAKALKEIRNEEGHELNVVKSSIITASSFLLALGFILKLCKMVRSLNNSYAQ
jgi:DNA repair exonuclease SbcCD ATPase subunit